MDVTSELVCIKILIFIMENIRGQFLFSEIFEKEEDIKDNPFVFEKFELGPKKSDYQGQKMSGTLLKKRKTKEVIKTALVL